MYQKTTSPQFLKYGYTTDQPSEYSVYRDYFENKNPSYLKIHKHPIRFEVLEGIAIVEVQSEEGDREQFVIHRASVIQGNTPYTVIPITQSCVVEVSYLSDETMDTTRIDLPDQLSYEPIRPNFFVTDIYSYYYNVKGKDYYFKGESHNFWEITYVDNGELTTEVEGEKYTIHAQEMMMYFPGQFHKQWIETDASASYLSIMFDLNVIPGDIGRLKNTVHECSSELYAVTNKFIRHSTIMERDNVPYSRDLMISYLQEIIIHLLQSHYPNNNQHALSNPIQSNFENEMMNEINTYIQKNIFEPITVEDICEHFSISRSTLQSLFKKTLDTPPKQYINDLKLVQAQRMILEEKYPITEIALRLGFSSIHYFSRKFKKQFGLAPSEYSQSLYKNDKSLD